MFINKLVSDIADKIYIESSFYIENFKGDEKMYIRLASQNGVFRLQPIQRQNDTELDVAIADLEKRGFILVKRDKTPSQYSCEITYSRVWAIMEKYMY